MMFDDRVGQRLVAPRGTDPEGQLRDLDRLRREVHAVICLPGSYRERPRPAFRPRPDRAPELVNDPLVKPFEGVVRLDQECPAAARRVADFQRPQRFKTILPIPRSRGRRLRGFGLRLAQTVGLAHGVDAPGGDLWTVSETISSVNSGGV